MARFLYDLAIRTYFLLVQLASFRNPRAKKFLQGREGLYEKLRAQFQHNQAPVAWFHCASLGEFEQGRPVIEAFRSVYPEWKILVTFFSPSGYEVRKNYPGADFICYLPFDSNGNAVRFIDIVQPKLVFFIKYEFWYHYLRQLYQRKVPVLMISGIFRENQLFFKWYGGFYRDMLAYFQYFFLQNQESYLLLKKLGLDNLDVSGDTRFDRVKSVAENPQKIEVAEIFSRNSKVMVLGSTWPVDMEKLLPVINDNGIDLKYIIAPHNIGKEEITNLMKQINKPVARFSENPPDPEKYQVLVIDNIGMLSSIYQYGMLAYVGGAFRHALHNTLEAAVYGIPVLFGEDESNRKFQEALNLVKAGGGFTFTDSSGFKMKLIELLESPEKYSKAATAAAAYVSENTGATGKILEYVKKLI